MKQQINFRASDLTIRQLAQLQNLTGMSQTELISTAVDRMYREEKMNANRLAKNTVCYLENPWSGTVKEMPWGEIEKWAEENVHDSARNEWLREARRAAAAGDSKALGEMIIGS